jgi:hypothetical protein
MGYSRSAALRKEQCDMITWSIVRQRLGKHISMGKDTHAKVVELLGQCSMCDPCRGYIASMNETSQLVVSQQLRTNCKAVDSWQQHKQKTLLRTVTKR